MGTPGSADDDGWTARAEIYAGRPDPSWRVQPDDVAALEALWAALPPFQGTPPRPPQLGYRGCRVTHGEREFFAYGGVVTATVADSVDVRADVDEAFERRALASAPPGVVPAGPVRR